jgi:hypothetical protein
MFMEKKEFSIKTVNIKYIENYGFVHLIHKRKEEENSRKIIRDMVLCLRDNFNFSNI